MSQNVYGICHCEARQVKNGVLFRSLEAFHNWNHPEKYTLLYFSCSKLKRVKTYQCSCISFQSHNKLLVFFAFLEKLLNHMRLPARFPSYCIRYSVVEMEVLGELQLTKNFLGSDEMLLARLGDELGQLSDDLGDV